MANVSLRRYQIIDLIKSAIKEFYSWLKSFKTEYQKEHEYKDWQALIGMVEAYSLEKFEEEFEKGEADLENWELLDLLKMCKQVADLYELKIFPMIPEEVTIETGCSLNTYSFEDFFQSVLNEIRELLYYADVCSECARGRHGVFIHNEIELFKKIKKASQDSVPKGIETGRKISDWFRKRFGNNWLLDFFNQSLSLVQSENKNLLERLAFTEKEIDRASFCPENYLKPGEFFIPVIHETTKFNTDRAGIDYSFLLPGITMGLLFPDGNIILYMDANLNPGADNRMGIQYNTDDILYSFECLANNLDPKVNLSATTYSGNNNLTLGISSILRELNFNPYILFEHLFSNRLSHKFEVGANLNSKYKELYLTYFADITKNINFFYKNVIPFTIEGKNIMGSMGLVIKMGDSE